MTMPTEMMERFATHPPKSDEVSHNHDLIRIAVRDLVDLIWHYVPDSRERSTAITKAEEVMFWANAGIARNQ